MYYLLWLAAGLLIVAGISAAVALHWRNSMQRRLKAAELLEGLSQYSDWVLSQQRTAYIHGAASEGDSSLRRVQVLRQQWFPEFSREAAQLQDAHERLIEYLQSQLTLRFNDAEAWLDSDPDAGFMELWAQHRGATQQLAQKVAMATGIVPADDTIGVTFPA